MSADIKRADGLTGEHYYNIILCVYTEYYTIHSYSLQLYVRN